MAKVKASRVAATNFLIVLALFPFSTASVKAENSFIIFFIPLIEAIIVLAFGYLPEIKPSKFSNLFLLLEFLSLLIILRSNSFVLAICFGSKATFLFVFEFISSIISANFITYL